MEQSGEAGYSPRSKSRFFLPSALALALRSSTLAVSLNRKPRLCCVTRDLGELIVWLDVM